MTPEPSKSHTTNLASRQAAQLGQMRGIDREVCSMNLEKLIQQVVRKSGVGEVRICYFDTAPPVYYARAMPDYGEAQRLAAADLEAVGRKDVSFNELANATARRVGLEICHGKGATPEEAVRNLLAIMLRHDVRSSDSEDNP